MASFQAKNTWDRPRKGENKNYRSDHFLPVTQQRIQKKKKSEKIQQTKKHHCGLLLKPKQNGKSRERVKINK